MKSTQFNKKLFLNKRTVADLGLEELKEVHGGFDTWKPTCIPIDPTMTDSNARACCCE